MTERLVGVCRSGRWEVCGLTPQLCVISGLANDNWPFVEVLGLMLFWIIIAVLTALVAALLLAPLMRAPKVVEEETSGEAEVYKDQLKEIDRDLAGGLINAQEAENARAEIGRRLIAVSAQSARSTAAGQTLAHRIAQALVIALVPAVGLGAYLYLGSPGNPDQPLEARLANPGNNMELLVAKAERYLADNPDDGKGWDILAPIYLRSGRLGDAELAWRNAMRLQGVTAERVIGLGETLVQNNQGIVTEDARAAFQEGARLDPKNPRARFYLALAIEQAGRREEAKAAFEAFAKESPADAPWQPLLKDHIAANSGEAPPAAPGNPSAADVQAAAGMSAGDRQQMIRSMVEGLDAKLKDNPKNFEGWMRLVRSYAMLGEKDKANAALKTSLENFPATGQEGAQLVTLGRDLGLDVEGATK